MTGPNVQVLLGDDNDNGDLLSYDITQWVDLQAGITINRGRQDEFGDIQASTCSLTLDNTDGRFTPPGYVSKNLVPNGSFENGTLGWIDQMNCTIATSSSVAAVGSHALAITSTSSTGTDNSWVSSVWASAQPGQVLTAQAQFRASSTARSCMLGVRAYDVDGFETGETSVTVTDSTTVWQSCSVSFQMPAGTRYVEVGLWVSNAANGEVHYADAVMLEIGSTPSAFVDDYASPIRVGRQIRVNTTVGGTTYTRFTGTVTSWPVEWPGGNRFSQLQITATDRMTDLARQTLRSVTEQTILPMAPTLYYTLGEPTGSTSAGDTSGNGWPSLTIQQRGTGGSVGFGQGTGPGTDSMPAAMFSPVDANNGQYLRASFSNFSVAYSAVRTFRVVAASSTAAAQVFAAIGADGASIALGTDATGHAQATYLTNDGTTQPNPAMTGTSIISDGRTHDLVIVLTPNSAGYPYWDPSFYVDGKLVASLTNQMYDGAINYLYVGGTPAGTTLATATISHVSLFPSALATSQISDLYHSVSDGFTADRSDQRIARYASWVGLSSSALDTGVLTSVAHQDTANMSVLDAMKNVATAEGGVLYVNHLGQVTFQARNHRYGAASKATLHADDIGPDTSFQFDTQGLINTVTASRPGGATQTATNSTSVSKYGAYPQSLSLLTTSDTDALNAATWMSALHSEPYARISATTVDLLTQPDSFVSSMLGLSLGDRISLTGMPSQAPSESDLNVEGWAETIGANAWSMNLNTSRLTSVFTIEDPTYGSIETTNRLAY